MPEVVLNRSKSGQFQNVLCLFRELAKYAASSRQGLSSNNGRNNIFRLVAVLVVFQTALEIRVTGRTLIYKPAEARMSSENITEL